MPATVCLLVPEYEIVVKVSVIACHWSSQLYQFAGLTLGVSPGTQLDTLVHGTAEKRLDFQTAFELVYSHSNSCPLKPRPSLPISLHSGVQIRDFHNERKHHHVSVHHNKKWHQKKKEE